MNKYIVTTTIQPPTKATYMFAELWDWTFVIVGDLKTPHSLYENKNWIYIHPETQAKLYPELSEAIGWNCIMRRNIGFLEAYKDGADVVASIDDDNIPFDDWGSSLLINKTVQTEVYESDTIAFDPLSVSNHPNLWHRGFPIQDVEKSRNIRRLLDKTVNVQIQAGLWNGDPDIDALCRVLHNPKDIRLKTPDIFMSNQFTPFNSQNTFISRKVIPFYMVLPFVGRMDDIWGGLIAQYLTGERPIFTKPTTYQERNEQSLERNMHDEVKGYINNKQFIKEIFNYFKYLPKETQRAFNLYRRAFGDINVK